MNEVLGSTPPGPPRGPDFLSPIYGDHKASGLYDSIANQIASMGSDALANVDYGEDFTRVIEDWSKHYHYIDKNGEEFRTSIVGEIAGPVLGTLLRSNGNYFTRDNEDFKPIDDKSKIKDTIALHPPTCSTVRMYNTYLNQTIAAGQVPATDADEDKRNGKYPIVKSFVKPKTPGSSNNDVMILTMLPKYGIPSAAGAPKAKRLTKRALDEVDDDPDSAAPQPNIAPDIPATARTSPRPNSEEDIKLGAFYDPFLLEDYGGDYFNHIKAKLVQLDVRGVDNELIPPWEFYSALKPGTLILALCSFHCYNMVDTGGKEIKERRIYQMTAHSIRILAESDSYVETRTTPIAPTDAGRATAKLPTRAVASSFANFQVPDAAPPPSAEGSTSTLSGDGDVDMTNTDDGPADEEVVDEVEEEEPAAEEEEPAVQETPVKKQKKRKT
ncbi:hypothetical protein C8R46DRAFT_1030227 [Mycena filopes]|nr:hypothetical protein C8R46DRAFT_1030227 [Mycena filopes]